MATTFHTQLQQLYVAYFNRPADPGGLAFYEGHLEAGTVTMAAIAADFAKSNEYRTEYNDATNTGIVTKVYANLFGRVGTANEMKFWIDALNAGATTIDKVVTDIAAGAQSTDKVAFESKVVFATAFTNKIDTDAEIKAYGTKEAQAAAKALVTGIKTATEATEAVAKIDAHVAAVVKAGTPFTLESGLAALNAANTARADFLKASVKDVNGDKVVDDKDVAAGVTKAQGTLNTLVGDAYKDATSTGVKAAILADKIEANGKALVTQQEELTVARAAVEKVTGLNTAIDEYSAAQEAREDADAAVIEAASTLSGAAGTLTTRYTANSLTVDTATGIVRARVDANGDGALDADPVALTVANPDGTIKLNTGVTAATWTGLSAVITAFNASKAAVADAAEAATAETFAQLAVEVLDVSAGAGATALKAIPFKTIKPADADQPTISELMDEMSALTAANVAADTKAFNDAIDAFLTANTTVRADAVMKEEKDVAAAEKAIADLDTAVTALEDAQALATELKSLDAAIKAAEDEFGTNDFNAPKTLDVNRFGTSGSDIFVAGTKDVSITSFGRSGDDVLYIGSGYKLNTTGDIKKGVDTDLEVFFIQKGNDTVVTIETKAFGSNAADPEIQITLTGVKAADLHFDNGIISM